MELFSCYTRSAIFPTPQRRGLRVPEQDRPNPRRLHHHGHSGQGEGQGGRRHDQHGGHQGARPARHEGLWMHTTQVLVGVYGVFACFSDADALCEAAGDRLIWGFDDGICFLWSFYGLLY